MTIEERAHQQAQEWADPAISWAVEQELVRFGVEQKAIMLDRLKEFMNVLMLDTSSKERLYKYLADE